MGTWHNYLVSQAFEVRLPWEDKPPLETRKRLERLLQRIENEVLSPDGFRIVRAIDVLEREGSAESRELLKTLAMGSRGAQLTIEAEMALKRLLR